MPTMRHLLAACLLIPLVLLAPEARADQPTEEKEVEQLKKQVAEFTELVERIRKGHENQIARLKAEIDQLREEQGAEQEPEGEDELAALRALALAEAGGEEGPQKAPEETVFKAAGLSLQQLNPEISASGDFLASYHDQDGARRRTDAEIRGLELNFQSYLDPFSRMKATTHISDDGVDVEEVYFTRFSVLGSANLDIGRFRQQFGVVNRWHEDALDQVHYPLALQRIFGDGGLNQTGASLDWTLPVWGGAQQELMLQVTNGENERLFDGDVLGTPSLLFHYKNFRDLSRDAYVEFGLSGLFGWNDTWDIQDANDVVERTDALCTRVFGADVSYLWEPVDRALYRNVEWRSEVYALSRDILAPDGSGRDTLCAWGAYSYIQSKIARNLILGVRGDYYEPDSKDSAQTQDLSLVPLAYPASNPYRWQLGPYVTWWQSEWVRLRGEYNYGWGEGMEPAEHRLWFQATFAVGPHKHERY